MRYFGIKKEHFEVYVSIDVCKKPKCLKEATEKYFDLDAEDEDAIEDINDLEYKCDSCGDKLTERNYLK